MIKKQHSVLVLSLLTFLIGRSVSQQHAVPESQSPLNPGDLRVVHFEEMKYPEIAQRAPYPPEGVVIVKVGLDEQGKVSEAKLISGNPILVPDTLANIRKWQFSSSKGRSELSCTTFEESWDSAALLPACLHFNIPTS